MISHESCPRCQLEIEESRKNQNPSVCVHCGHVVSDSQARSEASLRRVTLATLVGFSLMLLFVFFQLREWGGYMFEIRLLQVSELSGGSDQTYERLAVICTELQKYDCAESAYAELAHRDSKNWSRLGGFQLSRGAFARATSSFAAYFRAGHQDSDSEYRYAKALAEVGEYDQAQEQFEKIIASKPDVLQITVVQNYVKYLILAGRLDQAAKVINRMRRLDDSKSQFMDTEYRLIAEKKRTRG